MLVVFLMIACGCLLAYWIKENRNVKTTSYCLKSNKVDNDYNIAFVSDIHNTEFGEDNCLLLEQIKSSDPDVILCTGDLIDRRLPNEDVAIKIAKQLVAIAPVYFVLGNHEVKYKNWKRLEKELVAAKVNIIRNNKIVLDQDIELIGIDDVNVTGYEDEAKWQKYVERQLDFLCGDNKRYTILLSHMPQFFDIYSSYDIDLTLCGHAHGGQIRLPYLGGLYSPGQGLLPKYTSGMYCKEKRCMIVSRGLGNSGRAPLRINNNPEFIEIKIVKGE